MKSKIFLLGAIAMSFIFTSCEKEEQPEDLNRGSNWVMKPDLVEYSGTDEQHFDLNQDGKTDITWEREKTVSGGTTIQKFNIVGSACSFSNQHDYNGNAYEKYDLGDPFDGSLDEHWCNHGWYTIYTSADGSTNTWEVGVNKQKYIGFKMYTTGKVFYGWLEIVGKKITTICMNKTANEGVTFGNTGL